ncbi:RE1, partial [Symbiodinium sp. CCMP2456]
MTTSGGGDGPARSKDGVPQWDGNSATFQRYEEEALLWQEGIAYHKRYMAGPRLVAELQGSAKRMVVGKSASWVSYSGGVEVLMRHLRDCLGRPQVAELTEYLNQYFRHSRRRNGESINEYVTRKSEIYMRAQQALHRVKPHQEPATYRVSREAGYPGHRRSSWTSETTTTAADGDEDEPEASTENTQNPSWDASSSYSGWGGMGGYWNGAPYSNWWSSSTWNWADSRSYGEAGATPGLWNGPVAGQTELLPEWVQAWYLLQDANLSTGERNMIFTALKGEFSVLKVAQELRNQWTETDLKKRDQHYKGSGFLGEAGEDEDNEQQEAWQAGEHSEYDADLNDEGAALVAEAEDEARQAWATLQTAKRTLKDARQRQHQVRMSRKYYQSGGSSSQTGPRPRDDSRMTCLKCGQIGHRAANCPQEKAHVAEDQSAPFVCFAEQALLGGQESGGHVPTTTEAVQAGWGVIDGGATRTLGSVKAIEAVMKVNEGKHGTTGVKNVDLKNRPVFGFADSGEAKCVSTIDLGLQAGSHEGMLRVHALNKGSGPILVSVATLRALGAIIDFEEDILVLRKLDPTKLIPLQRSTTGHQLVNLTDDLFREALPFPMPAMEKMNAKQLREAIGTFGEIPAESWNNSQLRHRLQELMTEQEEEWANPARRSKDTPLQQQIKQLNRNKRKKADLQEYVAKVLGLTVSENETMMQLETKALDHLYANVESCGRDAVGFGRHASLTYAELVQQYPRYTEWVKATHKETDETNPRLKRLAAWLLRATDVSEAVQCPPWALQSPPWEKDPQRLRLKIKGGYLVEPEAETPQTASTSSAGAPPYPAQQMELMTTMMETMKGMQEDIKELRQMSHSADERPRKKESLDGTVLQGRKLPTLGQCVTFSPKAVEWLKMSCLGNFGRLGLDVLREVWISGLMNVSRNNCIFYTRLRDMGAHDIWWMPCAEEVIATCPPWNHFPQDGAPFPPMWVLRLDPAGSFRSQHVESFCDRHKIFLEIIPGEAHWKLGICEQAVQGLKEVMTKTCLGEEGINPEEALATAVMTFNHRDIVRGFSPVQHALGHNPDQVGPVMEVINQAPVSMLWEDPQGEVERASRLRAAAEGAHASWIARQRIVRAQNSKGQPVLDFQPGELVYLWRAQTGQQGRRQPGDKHGQFIGPARILATEKKKDESGHLVPGSSVWLVRGRSLIKCCPEQLRRASQREELLEMLAKPEDRTPWSFQRVAAEIGGNQVKDYSQQRPTPPEWHGAQDVEETAPPTRVRFRGKRAQPEAMAEPMEEDEEHRSPASASSSRARLEGAQGSGFQAAEAWWASVPDREWEPKPAAYWNDEDAAVSVEIELPTNVRGLQKTLHQLPSYFVGAMKRRAIEVCERKLSPTQKEEFRAAKNIEVRNFIASKAFEVLPEELKPSREQAINMRWILTWKSTDSGGQKAKARAVLLGYQDPKYEHRSTTAPVMTRQTRQMQLQLSTNRGWTVQKGDVSGAFLQGREYPDQLFCIPCKEICEAMGLPEGTITRLRRACYGLVDAPLEWYRTVDEYLVELGLERTHADACAWVWRPNGKLRGMISGHVDDFLFSGGAEDADWQALLEKIRQRFKWGDWDQDKFVQCGVHVERTSEGFLLSQPTYLEGVKEIPLSSSRRKMKDAATGEREKTQLRALLGGLSWHAQQVAPHLSAEVSLLLSEISESNVNTIIKANLLAHHAKARQDHQMLIHRFSAEEPLALFGWVDAASQNRREGGSTQGIFIGMGPANMLQGEMGRVTPIAWHSNKIDRACRSPGAAEAQAAVNGEDALYFARYQWSELCFGNVNLRHPDETVAKVTGCLVTDSRNVYDKLYTEVLVIKGAEKRTNIELLAIKEAQRNHGVLIRWVHSEAQLANALTKHGSKELELYYRMRHAWRIVE